MRTFVAFICAMLAAIVGVDLLSLLVFGFNADVVSALSPLSKMVAMTAAMSAGLWLACRWDHQHQGWLWFGGIVGGTGGGIIMGAISSLVFHHTLDPLSVGIGLVLGLASAVLASAVLHFLAPTSERSK